MLLFAFILTLLFGILLIRSLSSTPEKKFEIVKKDDKLLFYDLKEEDIKRIDWDAEVS